MFDLLLRGKALDQQIGFTRKSFIILTINGCFNVDKIFFLFQSQFVIGIVGCRRPRRIEDDQNTNLVGRLPKFLSFWGSSRL